MNPIWIWLILAIVAGWGVFVYNRLVAQRNLLSEARSGMDVQLKRRHDLVPNLVEVVRGYAKYEQQTLEEIVKLRSQVTINQPLAELARNETAMSQQLRSLLALVERYPDLKADGQFTSLHANLVTIEDDIQMSRRYYNGSVRNLNILVESFPSNMIAGAFHFKPAEYFEIEYATERAAPEVKFDR